MGPNNSTSSPYPDPNSNYPSGPGNYNNPNAATSRYMDEYCNLNANTATSRNPRYASAAACIRQQKEQVCNQFNALPADVKAAIDEDVSCTDNLTNNAEPSNNQQMSDSQNCSDADSALLQLLKKYWSDQNTAYAIVFLPDQVFDSSTKCMKGNNSGTAR